MRKYLYMVLAALIAVTSLTVTSCSSDDDESDGASANIVGAWELTSVDGGALAEYIDWKVGDTMTFSSDGSYTMTRYNERGKWSLSGSVLKLYDITSSDGTVLPSSCTCTISGDTMTLYQSTLGVTYTFERE